MSISQNIALLTPAVIKLIQNWVKRAQISCTNGDRMMKNKSKRYFEVNYFLSFDLTWRHHQPKIGSKRVQTHTSCTNGERKIKIKREL